MDDRRVPITDTGHRNKDRSDMTDDQQKARATAAAYAIVADDLGIEAEELKAAVQSYQTLAHMLALAVTISVLQARQLGDDDFARRLFLAWTNHDKQAVPRLLRERAQVLDDMEQSARATRH